jgi:hypothetical protein
MEIGVYFLGVCTHVWWGRTRPTLTNRVVLVNGTGHPHVHDKDIPEHIATLRIDAEDIIGTTSMVLPDPVEGIVQLELTGVRIQIANTIEDGVDLDDSFGTCIPSLDTLTPGIGRPSKAAVDDGRADLTSCIFDLTGGRLQGGSNEPGAAFGYLRSVTSGAPRLRLTPFGSEAWSEIQLRDNAQITISNLGATPEADDEWDFYLHYKLAETLPAVLAVPDPSPCRGNHSPAVTWPPGFKSVGPGCSNSAYP